MSDLLDKLDADERKRAEEREQRAEANAKIGAAERAYCEAWKMVERYAGIGPPEGKSPSDFYCEAEEAFQKLAAVLVERGWDKQRDAVAQAIEQGRPGIDPSYQPGELAIAELLRLALDKATPTGTIARELQRLAERERRSCGLAQQVSNVEFVFLQCVLKQSARAATAAPVPPAKADKGKGDGLGSCSPLAGTGEDVTPACQPATVMQPQNAEAVQVRKLKAFDGGEMVFYDDHVELCGVTICGGPRCQNRRSVLDLLRKKKPNGCFVAYSGEELGAKAGFKGQGTTSGVVRDLRTDIVESLRDQAHLTCGRNDVILSGGPGYRFADCVAQRISVVP
jgi:hypothetical protein